MAQLLLVPTLQLCDEATEGGGGGGGVKQGTQYSKVHVLSTTTNLTVPCPATLQVFYSVYLLSRECQAPSGQHLLSLFPQTNVEFFASIPMLNEQLHMVSNHLKQLWTWCTLCCVVLAVYFLNMIVFILCQAKKGYMELEKLAQVSREQASEAEDK